MEAAPSKWCWRDGRCGGRRYEQELRKIARRNGLPICGGGGAPAPAPLAAADSAKAALGRHWPGGLGGTAPSAIALV